MSAQPQDSLCETATPTPQVVPAPLAQPEVDGAPHRLRGKMLKKLIYSPFLLLRARMVCRDLLPHLRGARRVLDYGCGDMVITRRLGRDLDQTTVEGVDIIDNNLTQLLPTLYTGERLPYPDDHFDASCVVLTLHHCDDASRALREVRRVSRRRVVVIEEIVTHRLNRWVTYFVDWVANRLESFHTKVPLNFKNDQGWKRLFERLQLRLVDEKKIYSYPYWFLTKQKMYVLDVDKRRPRS